MIGVTAVGAVDEETISAVVRKLGESLGVSVRRLPALPEPALAYDERRRQYVAPLILRDLAQSRPGDIPRVIGIAEVDLFIPMLSFVFGLAQLSGTVALISLARLRSTFYYLPLDRALLLERAGKEAVHEIGHTYGLVHCSDRHCPMSLSNTVGHVDEKKSIFCPTCRVLMDEALRRQVMGNE